MKKIERAVDFDKPTVNAALQAIDDLIEDNKAAISTAIDNATAPYTFGVAEKKLLVAYYFLRKAKIDGA